MPVSLKQCKLGDVLDFKRGYDLPKSARVDGKVPIVSSSGYSGNHNAAKVEAPGVVTGRYGTLGEVFYIEEDFWPLNTALYVKDFKGNHPRYVSYFLTMLDIASLNAAGAVPGVNRNHLHMLDVEVIEDYEGQAAAADKVEVYDNLIENNNRRIAILEEMAQSLYREWFVKFRFPGHENTKFIESSLGKIPEGWEVKSASEVIDIAPKMSLPKVGAKPFVSMPSVSTTSMVIGEVEMREGNSGTKFINGDTLLARITPCLQNGKTGFIQFLEKENPIGFGSTEFIVMRSKGLTPEFVYCLARSDLFRGNAINSMAGADGRQRVKNDCFVSYYLAVPPMSYLNGFSKISVPLFKKIFNLDRKNKNLKRQRDMLLPRLISGTLEI